MKNKVKLFTSQPPPEENSQDPQKKDVDENSLVAKDNGLIPMLLKYSLTELRFIAFGLAHYNSVGTDNYLVSAKVEDMTAVFPSMGQTGRAYEIVEKTMLSLGRKPLEFYRENGNRVYINWFHAMEYFTGEGRFEFHLSPALEPFCLALKNRFTRYQLSCVANLSSATTWRLYENLKQDAYKDQPVKFKLDDLKKRLGLEGKYQRFWDFVRRVLDPGIKEINRHTDILVSREQIKSGCRIVGIAFTITIKENAMQATVNHKQINGPPADQTSEKELNALLSARKVSRSKRKTLIKQVQKYPAKTREEIAYQIKNISGDNPEKLGGYLVKCLENKLETLGQPEKQEKKTVYKSLEDTLRELFTAPEIAAADREALLAEILKHPPEFISVIIGFVKGETDIRHAVECTENMLATHTAAGLKS